MSQYLIRTRFAAESLLQLICHEDKEIARLHSVLDERRKTAIALYEQFRYYDESDDHTEGHVMQAYSRSYQAHEGVKALEQTITEMELGIHSQSEAYKILCGALLQIAKQGISIVYHGLDACPEGRLIGTVPIKSVIWQGRNQSLHYEEGSPRQGVRSCFQTLEVEQGDAFSLSSHPNENLASSVIELLGWHTYQQYHDDMSALL